jgi:uncharacterized protein YuzE
MKTTTYFDTETPGHRPEAVKYRSYVEKALTEYAALKRSPMAALVVGDTFQRKTRPASSGSGRLPDGPQCPVRPQFHPEDEAEMKVRYYPKSDMLAIALREVPATGGGEDVAEGVTFSYDHRDRLVLIEIEDASQRVDLAEIKGNPANIADDSGGPITSCTVSELARELGVGPRITQKTIQSMAGAGIQVGRRLGPSYPIILPEKEAARIVVWRAAHRPGRPAGVQKKGRSSHGRRVVGI